MQSTALIVRNEGGLERWTEDDLPHEFELRHISSPCSVQNLGPWLARASAHFNVPCGRLEAFVLYPPRLSAALRGRVRQELQARRLRSASSVTVELVPVRTDFDVHITEIDGEK